MEKSANWYCILIVIWCLALGIFLVSTGYAEVISSAELIERAKDYDGKTIEYQGEVVGEVMVRGDGAWFNLYDGERAIGIWADAKVKERITHVGSYKYSGDYILIKGEFHRACSVHGGDLDIHASEIHILNQGQRIKDPLSKGKFSTALILSFFALCLILVDLLWKRK